jgi:hypothetical protein
MLPLRFMTWRRNGVAQGIQPMARTQQTLDRQPGTLPDIRTDDGGITFVIVPPGAPHHDGLVIRCDDNGEVWASIRPGRRPADHSEVRS